MLKNALWLFGISVIIGISFFPSYLKLNELRDKNIRYEQEIIDLKRQNKELAEEYRKLENDPVYLEKVAREKMGLVRDGEVIYKMVPAEEKAEGKHGPR